MLLIAGTVILTSPRYAASLTLRIYSLQPPRAAGYHVPGRLQQAATEFLTTSHKRCCCCCCFSHHWIISINHQRIWQCSANCLLMALSLILARLSVCLSVLLSRLNTVLVHWWSCEESAWSLLTADWLASYFGLSSYAGIYTFFFFYSIYMVCKKCTIVGPDSFFRKFKSQIHT